MTAPLRRFLMNRQIEIEARRIAHEHTTTCNKRDDGEQPPRGDQADEHTKACNDLRRAIVDLCMQIKTATVQPPLRVR